MPESYDHQAADGTSGPPPHTHPPPRIGAYGASRVQGVGNEINDSSPRHIRLCSSSRWATRTLTRSTRRPRPSISPFSSTWFTSSPVYLGSRISNVCRKPTEEEDDWRGRRTREERERERIPLAFAARWCEALSGQGRRGKEFTSLSLRRGCRWFRS